MISNSVEYRVAGHSRRSVRLIVSFLVGVVLGPASVTKSQQPRHVALSSQESLELLEISTDEKAFELASEPLVVDPVDFAFDDAGRLWVVEMRDYPLLPQSKAPSGCIKVLTDTDANGQFDAAEVFADGLNMPTGLALWKDGVLATVAGELIYLQDTTGDGKADLTQQWLVGFTQDNEQLRENHPRLGPDGWFYIACGLRGGDLRLGSHFSQSQSRSLKIGSRDIRLHPQSGKIEAVTGPAQFGLTFSQLGGRVFCSNRNPAIQVRFEQDELKDSPLLGLLPMARDALPAGDESRVFPLVNAWTTSNLHAGQFTAACGVFLRHDVEHADGEDVFVCEPTGSLVKRAALKRGVSGLEVLEDAQSPPEWLASRDPWFRPVNMGLAPNLSLVVADMHRAVIEHPRWVPEELKTRKDERWGNSSGRLLEIRAADAIPLADVISELAKRPLRQLSDSELTDLIASGNQWHVEIASRILLERNAKSVAPNLLKLARDRSNSTQARIAAIQLATALDPSSGSKLAEILGSESDNAVLLAALRALRRFSQPETVQNTSFQEFLIKLATSSQPRPSPSLRFEILLTLSPSYIQSLDEDVARTIWNEAIAENVPDLVVAASNAMSHKPRAMLTGWLEHALTGRDETPGEFSRNVTRKLITSYHKDGEIDSSLSTTLQTAYRDFASNRSTPAVLEAWLVALETISSKVDSPNEIPAAYWEDARQIAKDSKLPSETRAAALRALRSSGIAENRELMLELARTPGIAPTIARECFECLVDQQSPEQAVDFLLERIRNSTPGIKAASVATIEQAPKLYYPLSQRMEEDAKLAKLFGGEALRRISQRAAKNLKPVFSSAMAQLVDQDRAAVIANYESCLTLKGQPTLGKEVFKKHCASCHRIGDVGIQLGPDISDSRTKQPKQILTSILDPNAVVDNNYFRFVAVTMDDQVIEGILETETESAIILIDKTNRRNVIRRDNLAKLNASGVSMMPEGFEAQIDKQQMADLVSFIKGWRYQDTNIPGVSD